MVSDWSSDKQAFDMPWGKLMMWIFLLSDTFIFSVFLTGYMKCGCLPPILAESSEVFALTLFGVHLPLMLIAIMTFILITSSGTMAMAVNIAYRAIDEQQQSCMGLTALLGASFVGMQAFEWTKLIVEEGIRPWGNPLGAAQFGSTFFMITGFHGMHVTAGVIYFDRGTQGRAGDYDAKGYAIVEIAGLYWHFVDLVWVFIFRIFLSCGEVSAMSESADSSIR